MVVLGLFRVIFRMRLEHVERVPTEGPVLVVSNHLHNADPVLINAAYPRPLHFMAKKEAFDVPVVRQIMRRGGAFPVDRGKADRAAIKRAHATLAQGIALGMFPEGTRSVTRSLQKAHAGVGMIALLARAPVQPVVITGTERLPLNGAKGKLASDAPMPDPGPPGRPRPLRRTLPAAGERSTAAASPPTRRPRSSWSKSPGSCRPTTAASTPVRSPPKRIGGRYRLRASLRSAADRRRFSGSSMLVSSQINSRPARWTTSPGSIPCRSSSAAMPLASRAR